MILMPFRRWTTQAVAVVAKQSNQAKEGYLPKCCSKYGNSLSLVLVRAAVSGLIVSLVYYYTFVGLEYAVQPVAGFYRSFIEEYPTFITSLLLPLFFFIFRIDEVLKLSRPILCITCACVSVITCAYGIINTLLFFFTTVMSLLMTFGRTSARQRWFYWIFTTHFCARAVTKLVSHFYGIVPPLLNWVLYLFIAAIYKIVAAFIYRKTKQTLFEGEDYHERFFQRGNAQVQIEYIKQRWHIFSFVIAVATICSYGQFGPSLTYDASDTAGNIFCKVDGTNQLECMVNVTYHNPCKSESEEHWINNSTEWDFCGALSF